MRMKNTVSLLLIIALLSVGTPSRAALKTAATTELKLRSVSQLRTEAEWYNTAVSELSRISAMKLDTVEQLAQANAIVGKNVSNLRYNRSRLVAIGLSDSTFVNAVKAKAADTKLAEQLAIELAKDARSIFKISGGQTVADRIRRSLEADVARIRQIAAQIKQAASDIRARTKAHHGWSVETKGSWVEAENVLVSPPQAIISDGDVAVIVIAVAVIAYPPLGLALFTLGNAAIYGNLPFVAVAVSLIDRLISNVGTEEGRNKVAECQKETDDKYVRCVREAAVLGLLRVPAEAACYADWLLGSGACLVTW